MRSASYCCRHFYSDCSDAYDYENIVIKNPKSTDINNYTNNNKDVIKKNKYELELGKCIYFK